jgi:hypothetical protein
VTVDQLEVGAAHEGAALKEVAHVVLTLRHQLERLLHDLLLVGLGLQEGGGQEGQLRNDTCVASLDPVHSIGLT